MNAIIKSQLQLHFSDRQTGAWFRLRSDEELETIVEHVSRMSRDALVKYKRGMGAQYAKAHPRKKRPAMGKLLLSLRDGAE